MSETKGIKVTSSHLGDLVEDPNNARTHSPRNIQMIVDSLQTIGPGRSIVIDENGVILAGNGVYEAAVQAGFTKVQIVERDPDAITAVRVMGLTEEQKLALALWDNRTGETSEWNNEVLQQIQEQNPLLLEKMFYAQELDMMFSGMDTAEQNSRELRKPGKGGDEFDDEAPQPTRVKSGDIWKLGDHFLMCGDSGEREDVELLFGADKASMLWTDPPYGVSIGTRNKRLDLLQGGVGFTSGRITENLENDTMSESELESLLAASFDLSAQSCAPGAAWYVTSPPGPLGVTFGSLIKDLGILRQTIVWVKNNSTFAPLGQDYHYIHEIMYYGWTPGAPHTYIGGRKQESVWHIDRPNRSPDHPTKKPIELVLTSIQNHLEVNSRKIVYDPFSGSGTTMVAAHRHGARAYCMEVAPTYCDVTLARAEAEGIGPIVRIVDGSDQSQ